MRLHTIMFVLMSVLSFASTSNAAKRVEPVVAVIPVAGKSGIPFSVSVKQLISIPLRDEVTVIGNNELIRSLKKLRIKPILLKNIQTTQRLGQALEATHILILEASGPAARAMVHIRLIDVESGDVTLTDSYQLKKNKILPNIAADILNDVIPALQESSNRSNATKDYQEGDPTEPTTKISGKKNKKKPLDEDLSNEESLDEEESLAQEDDEEETELSTSDTLIQEALPLIRIHAGTAVMRRTAEVNSNDPTFKQPAFYGPTGKSAQPFFAIPHLSLESFPLRNLQVGAFRNIGIVADGSLGAINSSNLPLEPNKRVLSIVHQFNVGLTYRFIIPKILPGSTIDTQLGFNRFGFPLEGLFPGVAYQGPYAGLALKAQVLPSLALTARGQIMSSALGLGVDDDIKKEFGSVKTGIGGRVGLGLKVKVFKRFEIGGEFMFQKYNIDFTGPARFSDFPASAQLKYNSLKDLKISDEQLYFLFTGGFVF